MFKKISVGLVVLGFASHAFAVYIMTPPQAFYYHASMGNMPALEKLKLLGRSVDSTDELGNTALCMAIQKQDYSAFNVLKQIGASTVHPCVNQISQKTKQKFGQDIVHPYLSLKMGYSKLKMGGEVSDRSVVFKTADSDDTWDVSVAAGVKFYAFRTELEYNQTLTTAKDTREFNPMYDEFIRASQSYRSLMLNGYYDIPVSTRFYPYLGAGVGLAQVKSRLGLLDSSNPDVEFKDNNFAFQLMAGVGYKLNENWAIDFGYRYINNGEGEWNIDGGRQIIKFNSVEHQVTAGVRYTF